MSDERKEAQRAADEFSEVLLGAVENGRDGDYLMCTAIVEAFRQHKGDDAAQKVRRVLWEMIREFKA